jgi:hypothetical protein
MGPLLSEHRDADLLPIPRHHASQAGVKINAGPESRGALGAAGVQLAAGLAVGLGGQRRLPTTASYVGPL